VQALRLRRLTVEGFRNLESFTFVPGPRFNVLFGDNGAGKSSLLEAIAYTAALRSFRQARKEDLIGEGVVRSRLLAEYESTPLPREVQVTLHRSEGRSVQLDGKRPRTLGSYYGELPCVVFHPADTELMMAAPEARRAFLDRVLEQVDAGYARVVDDYSKALRSRNRVLKQPRPDPRAVRSYDALLASHGARIAAARIELATELKPLVESHFAEITEQALPLELSYVARHPPEPDALARALAEHYERDVMRGTTSVGPHGDDLRASVKHTTAKSYASQGQHRALVLSLKVAEMSVLSRRKQMLPLLLLDDVSSELDRSKNRRFFELLARVGGQVFLTTTHREFILLDRDRTDFQLAKGTVQPL
jgi:DNA replication and repair protein RecF